MHGWRMNEQSFICWCCWSIVILPVLSNSRYWVYSMAMCWTNNCNWTNWPVKWLSRSVKYAQCTFQLKFTSSACPQEDFIRWNNCIVLEAGRATGQGRAKQRSAESSWPMVTTPCMVVWYQKVRSSIERGYVIQRMPICWAFCEYS